MAVLMTCSWRAVADMYTTEEGESGPAADTGSAMHHAAAEFHRGKGLAECLDSMRANVGKFPLADLQDAASMFLLYAQDPRNANAWVHAVEQPVAFSIDPAPADPTGERIQV